MASMTKQHFRALAEALASARPDSARYARYEDDPEWRAAEGGWRACCEAVAAACRSFNGAFDDVRFYEACGYDFSRGYAARYGPGRRS